MISAACEALLVASARYHPLYGDGLSNHLPMALIALDAMDARDEQLERFAAHYTPRLILRGAIQPALEPTAAFGERDGFEGVRSYFTAAIAHSGIDAVLHSWVPHLMPGVAASAFHALIRLAYGLEARHHEEIATALAYWVIEYRTLGELGTTCAASLQEIAAAVAHAVHGQGWRGRLIIDRMSEVATHPAVRQAQRQPEVIDMPDIARFALEQYAAREDFTLLHLVTGCHAALLIAPYAGEPTRAARYLWQAVLLASLTTARPANAGANPVHNMAPAQMSWQQCICTAMSSLDDHVVKLIYTARAEFTRTQDARYQLIAARKARLTS
jgi:hypothetical protein